MTYIYESPDGGQTVYRRRLHSQRRELHRTLDHRLQQQAQRQQRFMKIIEQAQTDPELNHMLEQIEIYASLKNTP